MSQQGKSWTVSELLGILAGRQDNSSRRILFPEAYPTYRNEPGARQSNIPDDFWMKLLNLPQEASSTHQMAMGTDSNNKAWAYPLVQQMQPGGWLQKLGNMRAWEEAHRTGQAIPFNNAPDALTFSQQYKKLWK